MHQPKPRLVVEFTKMNGAGNDFIVIDNRFFHFSDEELTRLAPRLCHRRFGIGADGVLAYSPPRDPSHHFRMRYVNADGSIGSMCGNGARCLARFARRAGLNETEMVFETDAGIVRARVPEREDAPVRIYLSPPREYSPEKQLRSPGALEAGPVHYIWTGTEHAVCFVDDVDAVPVGRWGPAIRRDPALQPAGANVDFVEVTDNGLPHLRARTFEKGVEDETFACGTGAVASAVVARLTGRISSDPIDVQMRGGTLTVGLRIDGGEIAETYLEGPVEAVFRGTFEV